MTRKEKLVFEIYGIKNEINILNGKDTINLDAFRNTNEFYREVEGNKVYELEHRLEGLKRELENTKVRMAQQAAADAFYATEEGQTFKRECGEKRALLCIEFDETESRTLLNLETMVNTAMGAQWRVGRLSTSYVELMVVDADNKPIFGQSVSIYYEKKCWLGGERFQINVGTCGNHDLLPEDRTRSMAEFYIGIGKLHANTELLDKMRNTLFGYAERIDNIQKEVRELDELVKNPTHA